MKSAQNEKLQRQKLIVATSAQSSRCDLQRAAKRPSDYLRNSNAEQLWRSRSNAISKRQVAEGQNLLQNPDRGAKDESNTILKFF